MADKKGGHFWNMISIARSILNWSWSVEKYYSGAGTKMGTWTMSEDLSLWTECTKCSWKGSCGEKISKERTEYVGKDVEWEWVRESKRENEIRGGYRKWGLCHYTTDPWRPSAGKSGTIPALTQDSSFDQLPAIHLFKEAGRRGRTDLSCQLLEKHQGLSGKKWREIN